MKIKVRVPYLFGWVLLASGFECLVLGQLFIGIVFVVFGAIWETRVKHKTFSDTEIQNQLVQMQESKHWYRNTTIMTICFLLWQFTCIVLFYITDKLFFLPIPVVLIGCACLAYKEFRRRYLSILKLDKNYD